MPTVDETRATYELAADAFVDLAAGIPLERYAGPGLGEWDLRSLVGHTGRSLETVTTYLGTRAGSVAAGSGGSYFAGIREFSRNAGPAVHERGVAAGRALGDDPVGRLRRLSDDARRALDELDGDDPVVETAAGGMRVSDYLPTRTFELTVHCLDIARAVGVDVAPPEPALRATLHVAADAVADLGLGDAVLLALTGREPLPAGCSVV